MIDPLLPTAAERIAALRQPNEKRQTPAYASKIVAAGISTTALFGLVTAMGWQDGVGSAQAPLQEATVPETVTPVVQVVPTSLAPTTVAPIEDAPMVIDTTLPPTVPAEVPVEVPAVVDTAPVVVPVAVPAPKPKVHKKVVQPPSNGSTQPSG